MTVQDFYSNIGGSYEEAMKQLRTDSFAARLITKFVNDPTFNNLTKALSDNDIETAFREAHTLKGVSANFAFVKLNEVSVILTDFLRPQNRESFSLPVCLDMYEDVKKEYNKVVEEINKFVSEQ